MASTTGAPRLTLLPPAMNPPKVAHPFPWALPLKVMPVDSGFEEDDPSYTVLDADGGVVADDIDSLSAAEHIAAAINGFAGLAHAARGVLQTPDDPSAAGTLRRALEACREPPVEHAQFVDYPRIGDVIQIQDEQFVVEDSGLMDTNDWRVTARRLSESGGYDPAARIEYLQLHRPETPPVLVVGHMKRMFVRIP